MAGFFVLALFVFTSSSFAALNAYLQLKGQKSGKTYKCKLDESGKFSFSDVEAGTYDLVFVLDGTRSQDDGVIQTIEISSFSWGASNAVVTTGTKITKSRSNIQNNKTAGFTVDASGPEVTSQGVRVATGDVDGDGIPDVIISPLRMKISNADGSRGLASTAVLSGITIAPNASVGGELKTTYDLKKGTK
jgi:hypothetical protein